jgi:hypothetical protein
MDDHERARFQMLDIDQRRMNRMVWRQHPVFALRFAMASRFTVDGFWLPLARSFSLWSGYGAVVCAQRRDPGADVTVADVAGDWARREAPASDVRAHDHTIFDAPPA